MKHLIILALAVMGEASKPSASFCCSALQQQAGLQEKVFFPNSTEYGIRMGSFFSANAALPPWCLAMPESTQDVSEIAKTLSEHSCPFGIRSGGHSAWEGSSSVRDGITVDFGNMNATTYNSKTQIASVQPGSTWGKAYTTLNASGVTAVGGRADVVGVGGFTTGGGYSFHSGSHGFACDNVHNFEIVLANGSIINANSEENGDIFKAQKGSSGNFGFVTRLDLYTIDSVKIWGGLILYNFTEQDAVFNAYIDFSDVMNDYPASQNILHILYSGRNWYLKSILSNSDAVAEPKEFSQYLEIANTSTTLRTESVADLVPEFTGETPLGLYANWFAGMTTNNITVLNHMYELQKTYVEKMNEVIKATSSLDFLVQFQPVPSGFIEHSTKQGGNMLGVERAVENGTALMWLLALDIDDKEDEQKILPIALEFVSAVNKWATEAGVNQDWVYLNYAWKEEDPIKYYGSENIEMIKAVSAKYDPQGVFQNLRSTGFKIPTSN